MDVAVYVDDAIFTGRVHAVVANLNELDVALRPVLLGKQVLNLQWHCSMKSAV